MMIILYNTVKERCTIRLPTILFRWQDNDDNSNQEEQQVSEEQYSDDYQYEQDRLTDDNVYSEYFRDDFNAGDRFTS